MWRRDSTLSTGGGPTITEIPELTRSTLAVIEYGLGGQRRTEVYVNRLLTYLLDPAELHDVGVAFLDALLQSPPDACQFEEDTCDLSDVQVRERVPVENKDDVEHSSLGSVDLVLDVPNE